jgi:hypothetical protein
MFSSASILNFSTPTTTGGGARRRSTSSTMLFTVTAMAGFAMPSL